MTATADKLTRSIGKFKERAVPPFLHDRYYGRMLSSSTNLTHGYHPCSSAPYLNILVAIGFKKTCGGKSIPPPPPQSSLSSAKEKRDEDGHQLEASARCVTIVSSTGHSKKDDVRDDVSESSTTANKEQPDFFQLANNLLADATEGLADATEVVFQAIDPPISEKFVTKENEDKSKVGVPASRSVFAVTARQPPKSMNFGTTRSKCVETSHVASLIGMPQPALEKKLRQLIQDGKLQGILDQGKGQLIVPEKPASSTKPSRPISSTAPPFAESSASFRAPTRMPQPVMAPAEDFLNPAESEEAKDHAAAAKKVLLLRTSDYVAYLDALLKANTDEDILSENEGINAIVNELLCFLAMKAIGKNAVPSSKIHRAWRVLVLTRPLAYIEMCKAMDMSSSFAIDDEKFDPDVDEGDSLHIMQSNMIKERYESTRTTYAALFQSQPPSQFWPPTSGGIVETSEVPDHLEFLDEENLLLRDDDLSTVTESTLSSYSTDDDTQETVRASDVLNEFLFGWTLADRVMVDLAKKNDEKDTLIAKRDQEIALLKNVMSPHREPTQDKPDDVEEAAEEDLDSHKELRVDFDEDTSPPPPQVSVEKTKRGGDSPSEPEHVQDKEELSWQKNITNYFSEQARILAEAADRSLAAGYATGYATATTLEEEVTFQSAPPLLDGLPRSTEPLDVALILDEDDKDIEMPCVECIVKETSDTRAFLRKKKAGSWIEIRASKESAAPGNSPS